MIYLYGFIAADNSYGDLYAHNDEEARSRLKENLGKDIAFELMSGMNGEHVPHRMPGTVIIHLIRKGMGMREIIAMDEKIGTLVEKISEEQWDAIQSICLELFKI